MKRATRLRPSQGGSFAPPVIGVQLNPARDPDVPHEKYRCFICGDVTANDRHFAVCAECDDRHGIRDKWAEDYGKIEALYQHDEGHECFCPGWLWMNEESDGSFNIERCDSCRSFLDD